MSTMKVTPRKSRVIGVLSIVPLVYMIFFVAVLIWWFTAFDPSKGENPQLFLAAFYSVAIAHVLVLLLMIGLTVYFLAFLRAEGAALSEKMLWAIALIFFNLLAYPFFYFWYVKPRQLTGPAT